MVITALTRNQVILHGTEGSNPSLSAKKRRWTFCPSSFFRIHVPMKNPSLAGWALRVRTKQPRPQTLRNAWVQNPSLSVKNLVLWNEVFYPIRRIGMASRFSVYGIPTPSGMESAGRLHFVSSLRIDSIHHFVMIPFAPSSRFHTATSCGFHPRLCRDFMVRLLWDLRMLHPWRIHLPHQHSAKKWEARLQKHRKASHQQRGEISPLLMAKGLLHLGISEAAPCFIDRFIWKILTSFRRLS